MAVGKEIRNQIGSIKSTQKITSAMEMVAASKMRKAQERMQATRPYAEKMRQVIGHIAKSNKDYRHQGEVLRAVASQVEQGSTHVMGVMLESHLVEGNQKISADRSALTYGQSVTDACISLETTAELLDELANAVKQVGTRSVGVPVS